MSVARAVRGMYASAFRPVQNLAYLIGGRFGCPRVRKQGWKGDRSNLLTGRPPDLPA